jgi:hypothetical protein
MKYQKVARGVALMLPLIMVSTIAPFAPSFNQVVKAASQYLTLSSFSGNPGVTIQVSGGGFTPSEALTLTVGASSVSITSAIDGTVSPVSVVIPVNAPQGAVVITAKSASGESATNSYYVQPFAPTLALSTGSTTPYSIITASGVGFAPGETVSVTLGSATASGSASSTGALASVSIAVPNMPVGSYIVKAVGAASGASAVGYLYVGGFFPSVSPSAYFLMPGAPLTFTGSGFAPGETVSVQVSGATMSTPLTTFTVDAAGAFKNAGQIIISLLNAGQSESFTLIGQTSNASASTGITVGQFFANVSPSDYFVMPGAAVSFNGSGFAPGEAITVTEDMGAAVVSTFTADTAGAFMLAGPVTIPFAEAGKTHVFHLAGGQTKASADATITVGTLNPQANPSDYFVMPGAKLTFTGSGFAPGEVVNVTEDKSGVVLSTVTASKKGAFKAAAAVTIPYTDAGNSHTFHITGLTSAASIDAAITVGALSPQISPSDYYIKPGSTYSVNVSSFAAGESVSLKLAGTLLGIGYADKNGDATFAGLKFPSSKKASLTLVALGLSSTASASVDVSVGSYFPYAGADNYYVQPGSTVSVSGQGFAPNETVTIADGAFSTTVVADAFGGTTVVAIVVPFPATPKDTTTTVTLTGSVSGAVASVPLTLAPFNPQVSPDTYYATPGTTVTFAGSSFVAGETVAVTLNKVALASVKASAKGAFAAYVSTLPFGATSADYVFTGSQSGTAVSLSIGLAAFYPGMSLDNYYAVGGSAITLSGSGFVAGETIALQFGATALGSVNADTKGAFSFPTQVPFAAAGSKKVTATGATSGAIGSTTFTQAPVYVSLQLGTYAGAPGAPVTFIGTGYLPGETVDITTDRTTDVVYHLTANATGSFNDSVYATPLTFLPGNLTLTATGEHSLTAQSIVYYVTGK